MTSAPEGQEERPILVAWGSVIRQYRLWKRYSRRELAQRAGLSPVYLGEIERAEKDPSSHSLSIIAEALDVPLGEMYLRVAARLDMGGPEDEESQPALPLIVRDESSGYLDAVSLAKDETAFDLYKIARRLRADQQLSLLMLARSLNGPRS